MTEAKNGGPQLGLKPLLACISPTPWEIEEGAYSWKKGEFSIWQRGARGNGDKKVAAWIINGADATVMRMAPAMLEALETIAGMQHCECDPKSGKCVMCCVRDIAAAGLAGQRLSG
jgi:hypothetical protein